MYAQLGSSMWLQVRLTSIITLQVAISFVLVIALGNSLGIGALCRNCVVIFSVIAIVVILSASNLKPVFRERKPPSKR